MAMTASVTRNARTTFRAWTIIMIMMARMTLVLGQPQNPIQFGVSSTAIVWSDIWDMELKWLSGGFGFDNIVGLPIVSAANETQALFNYGGSIVANQAAANVSDMERLTCASGADPPAGAESAFVTNTNPVVAALWGFPPDNPGALPQQVRFSTFQFLDGTPLCFSWPVLGETVNRTDIRVTLNTGEQFFPEGISTLPNQEQNEKHCLVIFMDLGNRIVPNGTNDCTSRSEATNTPDSCALYPKLFEIVGDLYFVGPPEGATIEDGPWDQDSVQIKNAKGMSFKGWPDGPHPYIQGPTLIGAHLTRLGDTELGDDRANDCTSVFPEAMCEFRLRFYYTGGYTPNGVSPIRPTDYEDHWVIVAKDANGNDLPIELANQEYAVGNGGRVTVVGLADLGAREPPIVDCISKGNQDVPPRVDPVTQGCYDLCYNEDYDNYIDIILMGNDEGMRSIHRLDQPADGTGCYREFYETGEWNPCMGKQPLYNPGGGGNVINDHPYFGTYVAGSLMNTTIDVVVDLDNRLFVSYNSSDPVAATSSPNAAPTSDPSLSPMAPSSLVPTTAPTTMPSSTSPSAGTRLRQDWIIPVVWSSIGVLMALV